MKDQNKRMKIKTKIKKRMNQPSLLLTAPLLKGGNRHLHIVKELVALANVIVHANHIIQIVNQKS